VPRVYASAGYAASLGHIGAPIELEHGRGWVLERTIPDTSLADAIGCYPLFSCQRWSQLGDDLPVLARRGLVSVSLVADAFAGLPAAVDSWFEVRRPFKRHCVADLALGPERIASQHHRYEARKALRLLEVDVCWRPANHLAEWCALYACLVARHRISGARLFPDAAFRALFAIEGVALMRAGLDGKTVGAQILVLQADVAHAHLAAFSDAGYRLGASYALDWVALHAMREHARWIDWGGPSGAARGDGLARYKKGWASGTRATWLLGAVLDRAAFRSLTGTHPASDYFPPYRVGEFRSSAGADGTADADGGLRPGTAGAGGLSAPCART